MENWQGAWSELAKLSRLGEILSKFAGPAKWTFSQCNASSWTDASRHLESGLWQGAMVSFLIQIDGTNSSQSDPTSTRRTNVADLAGTQRGHLQVEARDAECAVAPHLPHMNCNSPFSVADALASEPETLTFAGVSRFRIRRSVQRLSSCLNLVVHECEQQARAASRLTTTTLEERGNGD